MNELAWSWDDLGNPVEPEAAACRDDSTTNEDGEHDERHPDPEMVESYLRQFRSGLRR